MPELREVFEMTTRQIEPDDDAWRQQEQRQRSANRNKKFGALAVAAVIGIVAIAVILGTRGGGNPTTPANESAPEPTVEEVARGFVGAYGALDAERAQAYLADDADLSGLVSSIGAQGLAGTRAELRMLISYLKAARYQQTLSQTLSAYRCEETSSSGPGTTLRCPFDFQLFGSYRMGRGPFTGSYFEITVQGGEVVRASQHFEVAEFSPQMWEPFAAWVSSTYPKDAAAMYTDPTNSGVRLSEESVRLWERRIGEYVDDVIESHGPGQADGPTVGEHSRLVDGVSFSFTVPTSGWEQFGTISLNKSIVGPQGAEAMIFWTSIPDGVGADPCADVLSLSVGRSAADLAAGVARAPGTQLVTGPTDVTIGGLPAKHVVLTVREDLGCDPGYFYTWPDVRWGAVWPGTNVGDTIRVWIVEVEGTRLFIEAETTTQADSALDQELEQIVASIRFE